MPEVTTIAPPPRTGEFTILRGQCVAMFAYDVGFAVDLNKAAALLTREIPQRETLKHSRRAPKYFEYQPAPIRVTRSGTPVSVGRFTTQASIEALVYDFGAISITFTIPLSGPVEGLLPLSSALYENAALLAESRRIVDDLVRLLEATINKPHVTALVEDYIVFDVDEWQLPERHAGLQGWIDECGPLIARILRSDTEILSKQEVDDALSCRIAYADNDAALIDWNAALLFGREMQDVTAVLEFANVELLEMRFLDDQLDRALGEAYETSQRTTRLGFFESGAELRRISRMQIDSAILFEGVNNALKLLGDVYLSRVYRLAAGRLHLPEWDGSIIRKLGTLESIYSKLSDRQANRRMEILEWIIILLILFEVVMSFIR
ncbi:MAG TPA: hypothetical protein VD997_11320 [Phycisphaerales bacterium]|nr:hypothetical protein [Phycisphaerales bacterium]